MADANLTRRIGGTGTNSSGSTGNAIIRIITDAGNTITCTDGLREYHKTCSDTHVDIYVQYGNWNITVYTPNGSTSVKGSVNVTALKLYTVTLNPPKGHTYGIKIDTTNSSPNDAVTYTDDAIGFTPLSVNQSTGACNYGSWAEDTFMRDFLGCKPCLYKNGAVVGYLNPNDYSKFTNGTTADITSGNAGDVMVEFKKTWYKFSKVGNNIYFQISDYDRSEDGFVTTAFTSEYDGHDVDYMYYGAYDGTDRLIDNKNMVNSLSLTVAIMDETTRNLFYRDNKMAYTYAKNKGNKYSIESYTKRWYILGLLMLVCKGRDVKSALSISISGNITHGTSSSKFISLNGFGNKKGLFNFGIVHATRDTYKIVSTSNSNTITYKIFKVFGIEAFESGFGSCITGLYTGIIDRYSFIYKNKAPYSYKNSDITQNNGYIIYDMSSSYINGTTIERFTISDCIPSNDNSVLIPSTWQSDNNIGWRCIAKLDNAFFCKDDENIITYICGDTNAGRYNGLFNITIGTVLIGSSNNNHSYYHTHLVAS